MTKKRKAPRSTKAGRTILAALMDLSETLDSGTPLEQKYTVREVRVLEPGVYGARKVRAIRHRLQMSQSLFAHLLGVSLVLVQAWEQGKRMPNATARRLLDEIHRDPERWAAMLRPARAA